MRLLLLIRCFLFVGEIATLADDSNSAKSFREKCADSFSGNAWLKARGDEAEKYSAGSSMGYCLGTLEAFMMLGPFLAPELKFCPPASRPIMGLAAMSHYLKAHPDEQNDEDLVVMLQALKEEWPCK